MDASLSGDGMATAGFTAAAGGARALVLQPDGAIVLAGTDGHAIALARFDSDGTLDPTFSDDGRMRTDFGIHGYFDDVVGDDLALEPDGTLVVVGRAVRDFAVARFN